MTDSPAPRESADSARAANVFYLMSPDPGRIAQLILPWLAAATQQSEGIRTLVLTDDEETAVAVARFAAREIGGGLAPIVALTSAARAKRLLKTTTPSAVAMPTTVAVALLAQSSLPFEHVRQVVVTLPAYMSEAYIDGLTALVAEMPKGASRTVIAPRETPEVESLVERLFFKARRVRDAGEPVAPTVTGRVQVLSATTGTRWDMMRRLVDQLDPPAAVVLANDAATFAEAQHELAALGYPAEGPVIVTRDAVEHGTHLVMLMGVPDAALLQRAAAAAPAYLVVFASPAEIANVRAIAGNMTVQSITLDGPKARASSREAATRARLREILASGEFAREIGAIAPLLDEYDGAEIAAAALVIASEATRQPPAMAAQPTLPARPAPSREERPRDERPREDRRPPRDDRGGPPRDSHRGPPRGEFRGPPRDERRGPPRDDRRGPPRDDRRGPPRDDRRGPPRDRFRSEGARDERRGPPRGDGPRSGPRRFDDRKPRPGR